MKQNRFVIVCDKIFWALCSLKLAVMVILGLAIALATATVIESLYDTPTGQYWVYRALWFHGLLALLGINIFCVAVSRYPWKIKHIPFLLAHLGILILLAGSWITEKAGLDGNLRISEGETSSVVELDSTSFMVIDRDKIHSVPIQWLPPEVPFKPFDVSTFHIPYQLKVDQYLSHADPIVSFVPDRDQQSPHAIRLRLVGGPMGISQDVWLWEGAPGWKSFQAGPALFSLGSEGQGRPGQPSLSLFPEKDGSLSYLAKSSDGKQVRGKIPNGKTVGHVIKPGWKGNMTITVAEWIPHAVASTTYKPARIQHGSQAPTSAIHVTASNSVGVWLGYGDRAVLHLEDREVEIAYYPKRVILPFSLKLERFTVEHNPGTMSPASYSSRVTVLDGANHKESLISMNEPLEMKGYTVYQASYEDGEPRPVTSIFSVNRDPGRPWKYLGSALIVLGSVLLFAAKYRRKQTSKTVQVGSSQGVLPTVDAVRS